MGSQETLLHGSGNKGGAKKMSENRKYLLIAAALFFQFMLSGITAGFEGLFPLLAAEGVCSNMCVAPSSSSSETSLAAAETTTLLSSSSSSSSSGVDFFLPASSSSSSSSSKRRVAHPQVCEAQDLRLEAVFQWAISALNFSSLFVGFLLDGMGPRRLSWLASLLCAGGCLLVAFAAQCKFFLLFFLHSHATVAHSTSFCDIFFL
jgi:hypothetical protein